MNLSFEDGALLLVDSCGEEASLAVVGRPGAATAVLAECRLPPRGAASGLLAAVQQVLDESGKTLTEIAGLGVVSGPGSFTGVRVGLAVAKGLAMAAGLSVAGVSRLAVLAGVGEAAPAAALSAGRRQVYLRLAGARGAAELLIEDDAVAALLGEDALRVDGPEMADRLSQVQRLHVRKLTAADAEEQVRRSLTKGGTPLESLEANYVRDEGAIYRRRSEVASL